MWYHRFSTIPVYFNLCDLRGQANNPPIQVSPGNGRHGKLRTAEKIHDTRNEHVFWKSRISTSFKTIQNTIIPPLQLENNDLIQIHPTPGGLPRTKKTCWPGGWANFPWNLVAVVGSSRILANHWDISGGNHRGLCEKKVSAASLNKMICNKYIYIDVHVISYYHVPYYQIIWWP